MVWALLPLKEFVNAKQRLSGVLTPVERLHFFHCMVEDVLDVLCGHPSLEQTLIVSDDPSAKLLAEHYGLLCWPENDLETQGLNGVVGSVAAKLEKQGVDSLLVVHGDLPLLSGSELSELIEGHPAAPAVSLATDRHLQGSNCLLCSPPSLIAFQYGENSYSKHKQVCEQAAIPFRGLQLPGIACDIDNPEDLLVLLEAADPASKSVRYLQQQGIADRLRAMSIGTDTVQPDRDQRL